LANSRIRLPREAKSFFPGKKQVVRVVLRGRPLDARYEPRAGPDRPRSAVLRFQRGSLTSIEPNQVLDVSLDSSGNVCLD
jgi:hypothetical protein